MFPPVAQKDKVIGGVTDVEDAAAAVREADCLHVAVSSVEVEEGTASSVIVAIEGDFCVVGIVVACAECEHAVAKGNITTDNARYYVICIVCAGYDTCVS